jgi:DNA-binding Xre family transcriptional regulator
MRNNVTQNQIKKAKEFPIYQILLNAGYSPAIEYSSELVYFSPFTDEKTPSFNLNVKKNVFNDFSSGNKGDAITLYILLKKCTFLEAVNNLVNNVEIDFETQKRMEIAPKEKLKPEFLSCSSEITDRNLIAYAESRGISPNTLNSICHEITYRNTKGKIFKSIGFLNDLGGYELRSANFKSFIGESKGISKYMGIEYSDSVVIFEGFFDYLSYWELNISKQINTYYSDLIVLNSTSFLKNTPLYDYRIIHSFLNNDKTGIKALEFIKANYPHAEIVNHSAKFKQNDLNDYLKAKLKIS